MSTRKRTIIDALNDAVDGIAHAFRRERNMRLHLLFALLIIIIAVCLNFSKQEILLLSTIISFVFMAEMFNTAVEITVDTLKQEMHPKARKVKHISAGAVLIASINAVVAGYILFSRHLALSWGAGIARVKESPAYVSFIVLLLVLILVIAIKMYLRKGTPFRGGMPSGHAAFGFSAWTMIAFISKSTLITVLAFGMAVIIARSRIKRHIHSLWEVASGALLGIFVTIFIWHIFKV